MCVRVCMCVCVCLCVNMLIMHLLNDRTVDERGASLVGLRGEPEVRLVVGIHLVFSPSLSPGLYTCSP